MGAAAERRPGIGHVHRLDRGHLARVPEVAFVGGQLFGGRDHQHLVGGLGEAALRASQLPAQARSSGIDAFGVGQQLAAQAGQLHGPRRGGPKRREHQEQQ